MPRLSSAYRPVALFFALAFSGCGFFSPYGTFHNPIPPQFDGLANKSVAIVVLAQPATLDEFPGTREEISSFIIRQMQLNLPTTRILNPQEVIAWQNNTINWYGLSAADIGKHFDVDSVLFVEVLDYSSRRPDRYNALQGHLRANCKISKTDPAGPPVWSGIVEVAWPLNHPLDPTQTNENILRQQTLDLFSDTLVRYFYDHRDVAGNPGDDH